MHRRWPVFLVAAISVPAWAQGPIPLDGDFEVNSHTTGYQRKSSVAKGRDGHFVVTWRSESSPTTSAESVVARRFAADGAPFSTDFQVNTTTTVESPVAAFPFAPSPGVADDGDFVIVWQSYSSLGTDTSGYSIQGQRYAANGTAQGDQFQINSNTGATQITPNVAVEDNGDFVVVWGDPGELPLPVPNVRGQRYEADGALVDGEFQVNTTVEWSYGPDVGVDAAGNFVVVWIVQYSSEDKSGQAIRARRYGADGVALGDDFQVNTYTTGEQSFPAVGVADDGSFVVVWRSDGSAETDTDSSSIQGRRFGADGAALGNDFQVNEVTTGPQTNPSVSSHPGGGFVAVWDSPRPPAEGGTLIKGRVFAADGSGLGSEFAVNASTATSLDPAVAVDPNGWFVVTWTVVRDLLGSEKTNIAARQFFSSLGCDDEFEDGFESGDTSAWRRVVGEFAGFLDVNPGAALVGSNGLEVTVGGMCTAEVDRVIEPPPDTIEGDFLGCNTITARDVQVAGGGATFAAGNSITLDQVFSVVAGSPFVAALDPGLASGLAYVEEDSPDAADFYSARFDLRLDNLLIGADDHIELFNGYSAGGNIAFQVLLKRNLAAAQNQLLLKARLDGGTTVDTTGSEEVLPGGWNNIQIAWTAGDGDGVLVVSVNGAPFAGLTGLDNDEQQIDEVRLGYVGGSVTSTSGSLDLDEFSSCAG